MADADDKKKSKEELRAEKKAAKEAKKAEKLTAKEAKKSDGDDNAKETTDADASSGGIMQWIIMAVVILIFAAVGFIVGRLIMVSEPAVANAMQMDTDQTQEQTVNEEDMQQQYDENSEADTETDAQTWFYPLEPVTTNLDEPGAMRFIRATLTLEISSELTQEEGSLIIEEKKPVLTDWLTIYLGSLTIEDTSGGRNKKRIQAQMLDAFNETLFPDSKPKIKKILLAEFAIQ